MNILGEKFKLQRKKLGLSQKSLAEGICEQSQISKIERGHFIPSADLLFKLSQRLEVPLDYFFTSLCGYSGIECLFFSSHIG